MLAFTALELDVPFFRPALKLPVIVLLQTNPLEEPENSMPLPGFGTLLVEAPTRKPVAFTFVLSIATRELSITWGPGSRHR